MTIEVVEAFRPVAEGRLSLRVEMPDEPLRAYVDRNMWTTIVTNLVNNALKFTPDGEVKVSLSSEDNLSVLTVADTGIGIPRDEQVDIFERFNRGTSGDQQPGSGHRPRAGGRHVVGPRWDRRGRERVGRGQPVRRTAAALQRIAGGPGALTMPQHRTASRTLPGIDRGC